MSLRDPVALRAYKRDWARHHYKPRPRPTLQERLWSKVDMTGDCWVWTAALSIGGRYGAIRLGGRGGKQVIVHRLTYEWANGPIPDGLELDHLCRNHRCVNPAHLEAVTHAENIRRALPFNPNWGHSGQRRLTCRRGGHPIVTTAAGLRVCRECSAEGNRRYRQRRKVAA